MKNIFNRGMLFSLIVIFAVSMAVSFAGAEGLLNRNSGPSDLQKQELDDAYYRGYNDAKSGRNPVDYRAGGTPNNFEGARGAGRGALGGAAIAGLSDGDTGKGAAWGAGAGAIKGVVKKRRAAQQEQTWAAQLSDAYNQGYRQGMAERTPGNVNKPAQQ
jgi:hypothetical protein